MNATQMNRLIKEKQAYEIELSIGKLVCHYGKYYKKNGQNYELLEESSLLEFLVREYEGR